MWIFTVAIPVDAPQVVVDLVRGAIAFLRVALNDWAHMVVFHEQKPGGEDEPQN